MTGGRPLFLCVWPSTRYAQGNAKEVNKRLAEVRPPRSPMSETEWARGAVDEAASAKLAVMDAAQPGSPRRRNTDSPTGSISEAELAVGPRVSVNYCNSGIYHSGVIAAVTDGGRKFEITYDDGEVS